MLISSLLLAIVLSAQDVNPDAAVLQDFQKRVDDYMKIQNAAAAGLKTPKKATPEAIEHYQHELMERVHRSRKTAKQGDMFTPVISVEFRRLMNLAKDGNNDKRIKTSLKNAEPVRAKMILRVNQQYPRSVPLQSMPPTLLLNLPKLPPELTYRLVGTKLVLLDTKTNLIVDFIDGALT